MTASKPNTSVVEDYVKVIYSHTEWQQNPVTPSELAARLGLAASSVTEMVKKLAASGLATHVPYGAVTLTEEGRVLALKMLRRHRLIEAWLVDSFGYGWDEVHDEAEVLEHALSDRMLEAVAEQLGHPVRDPHGDPIPSPDGAVVAADAVELARVEARRRGRIVRVSDRDPMLLRYLAAEGIGLDSVVEVLERKPFGGALAVRVDGAAHDLGDQAASAIWVSFD